MGAKDSHGVVVTWAQGGHIHRPETGFNHGESVMRSDNWELFPSLEQAMQAGYEPCLSCFPHQRSTG